MRTTQTLVNIDSNFPVVNKFTAFTRYPPPFPRHHAEMPLASVAHSRIAPRLEAERTGVMGFGRNS